MFKQWLKVVPALGLLTALLSANVFANDTEVKVDETIAEEQSEQETLKPLTVEDMQRVAIKAAELKKMMLELEVKQTTNPEEAVSFDAEVEKINEDLSTLLTMIEKMDAQYVGKKMALGIFVPILGADGNGKAKVKAVRVGPGVNLEIGLLATVSLNSVTDDYGLKFHVVSLSGAGAAFGLTGEGSRAFGLSGWSLSGARVFYDLTSRPKSLADLETDFIQASMNFGYGDLKTLQLRGALGMNTKGVLTLGVNAASGLAKQSTDTFFMPVKLKVLSKQEGISILDILTPYVFEGPLNAVSDFYGAAKKWIDSKLND